MQSYKAWADTERIKLASLILKGGLTMEPEECHEVIVAAHAVLTKSAEDLDVIKDSIEEYVDRAN